MKMLKNGKKKVEQLGTSELKEGHGGELPGSHFCFIQLRLREEHVSHTEMPKGTDKKS